MTRIWKWEYYVISNILFATSSAVVTDPSWELHRKTSGWMKKRWYRVQVLQPANISQSESFNPLEGKKTIQELTELADEVAGNNVDGSDWFWVSRASFAIFICMYVLVRREKQKDIHMGNVSIMISKIQWWWKEIDVFILNYVDNFFAEKYKWFIAQDSKTLSNILSSAETALKPWDDQDLVKLTSTNTIDIPALRNEKTIIYMIIPERNTKYFSFIANLFYSTCFDYCMKNADDNVYWSERKYKDVSFILDEFWNLGKIKNFATNITTLWKYGCSLSLILQNISQLRKIYWKDDADSIFWWWVGNKLFLWWCDLEVCEYVEKSLWKNTVQETIVDVNWKKQTITVWQPLMTAPQIRMLREWEAILISRTKNPVKIKLRSCYKDKSILRMINTKQIEIKSNLSCVEVEYIDIDNDNKK